MALDVHSKPTNKTQKLSRNRIDLLRMYKIVRKSYLDWTNKLFPCSPRLRLGLLSILLRFFLFPLHPDNPHSSSILRWSPSQLTPWPRSAAPPCVSCSWSSKEQAPHSKRPSPSAPKVAGRLRIDGIHIYINQAKRGVYTYISLVHHSIFFFVSFEL